MSKNPLNVFAIEGEPATNTGGAVAFVAAVITLVVAFGLPLTDTQSLAILGVVTIAAPYVSGLITRRKVTPANEVAVKVDETGVLVAADALPGVPNDTEVEVAEVL